MISQYSQKTVISGDYIETFSYSSPITRGRPRANSSDVRRSTTRRPGNITRAKRMLLRLTHANANKGIKFVTLTYEDNVTDRAQAVNDCGRFVRRMRAMFPRVEYVYTLERQKRGAWHAHFLIFGLPFVHFNVIASWWKQGMIDIAAVRNPSHAAFYLAKYITKDTDIGSEVKLYSASHGLCKSKIFYKALEVLGIKKEMACVKEGMYATFTGIIVLTRAFICKPSP